MKLNDIIPLGIEIIFYTFHFSLLIVLIVCRKDAFHGAFFNMLRLLFISDILLFLSSFISRIPAYGLWRNFFETDAICAKFSLISVGYLLCVQFLIHAFIPFNRFTLFWFPLSYKKIWSKQWYTVVIIFIPLLAQIPWALEPAIFYFTKSGYVVLTYVNLKSMESALYLNFVCCCLMTIFAAIFNLFAVIKHYIHKITNPGLIQLKEITFLYISCILFFIHCIYSLTVIGRTVFNENPGMAYIFQAFNVIILDILSWSGSISLLIISKNSRKTYCNFFQNIIKKEEAPVSLKVSTLSKIQNTRRSQINIQI